MKAKDTVIKLNRGGILSDVEVDSYNNGAEAQAEVSFKAGIKEVVEWIKEMADIESFRNAPKLIGFTMFLEDWQANLKEWAKE